ncbi:hypothetical protein H8356DRAFT_1323855 [Neocallimastix lanati (nom. inval.)]|nr:hypothetical protein H8356DRAFT_1323855 [Neocallimastix sp. JGI-2020a]
MKRLFTDTELFSIVVTKTANEHLLFGTPGRRVMTCYERRRCTGMPYIITPTVTTVRTLLGDSDIESMLNYISQNINGIFIVLFMDYSLFNGNIDSTCIQYRQYIDTRKNKFLDSLDKESPVYLLGTL